MLVPHYHREEDPEVLRAFMVQYPFAWLFAAESETQHHLNPTPLVYRPSPSGLGLLLGHLNLRNPLLACMAQGKPVTALFLGPHGYVSPRWYANPKGVPTWNHLEVACTCQARVFETTQENHEVMEVLVRAMEGDAWHLQQLPPAYLQGLLKALTGFELTIMRWEGHFKLSQDKPADEAERVAAQFEAQESTEAQALASWMRRYLARR